MVFLMGKVVDFTEASAAFEAVAPTICKMFYRLLTNGTGTWQSELIETYLNVRWHCTLYIDYCLNLEEWVNLLGTWM